MSARILVVDDIETNRRLLEARLSAEYFEVVCAASGQECLDIAGATAPDLILLDVMMPGLDGFATCKKLKADAKTRHIPVVMVTALDQRQDRIKGLEAGADDFLTKPVDDIALFARVRSLLRLKQVMDELRLRDGSGPVLPEEAGDGPVSGRVVVIAGDARTGERLARKLPAGVDIRVETDPKTAIGTVEAGADLALIDLTTSQFDGLRLCARIRSETRTRSLPILAVVDGDACEQMVRALDLGVNDVLARPVDSGELAARTATQLKRARYAAKLRDRLNESLELAVTDPLTGLYNRRYLTSRLEQAIDSFHRSGEAVSLILFDIDRFKSINDTYGHGAGDFVLKAFARTMKGELRALDIAGRYGGEEFLVILAGASAVAACEAAERVRAAVARQTYSVKATGEVLKVTVSAGVAQLDAGETASRFLARVDAALYEAKTSGRNQVVCARPKAA